MSQSLIASARFRAARDELILAITQASSSIAQIKPAPKDSALRENYLKSIQEFSQERGRDLFFPFLASGLGSGSLIELADGSVKYDMITGIGVNFFGHSHPELMAEVITAIPADIMQGNLEPGVEAKELIHAMLSRVGKGSRLKHGWLMCSGTMVNEVALKIIRQKKAPATKILAFKDCFAGRSTAMQEITDNAKYREGQPTYGEVSYLSFYDSALGLALSLEKTLGEMKAHLSQSPGLYAALMMELVQGEGGFRSAPREFYVKIFEEAKRAGLAIWLDEIQTFGRTGELFAYQKMKLNEFIDVVTIGKMLQACMVLFASEFNPKPGLVAGTFSGNTGTLRAAKKTLELLDRGFLGPEGRIELLANRFVTRLEGLASGLCKGKISEIRSYGGMIGFIPLQGTMDDAKKMLMKLFDLGVIAFYCGHGPILIRLLPPLGVMTESQVDEVCDLIGRALTEVSG
ncbi:MAG: aminotransferase class III-fold pyridoxal phosphate-dependent enzyme [Bdellovibrionota bacterium]